MRALIEVTPPGHPHYAPFPEHLIPGIRPRPPHIRPVLGRLGANAVVSTVGSAAAGKAAGVAASAIATDAGIGAAAGPIGLVVGAVVGLVAGKLLNPQYLNVAQANATEATYVQAFNQYKSIAGRAAGRTFGLPTMVAVWKGAVFSGLFPENHNQGPQCFHEGCLALSGQPQWIDGTISGNGNATFPQAYAAMQSAIAAKYSSLSAASSGMLTDIGVPRGAQMRGLGSMAPVRARYEVQRRRRLGAVGITNLPAIGTRPVATEAQAQADVLAGPAAVVFIDTFWMPLQQRNSPPWGVPQNALEHQILYDVADAWLATQGITTAPYVAIQAAAQLVQAPPRVVPAAATPARGTPAAPVVIPPAVGAPVRVVTSPVSPLIAPASTPATAATPPAIATAAGTVTTVSSATQANLNAALAAQGFNYVGASNAGYPIYADAGGNTYVYANNQLVPYASVAQVAATGGAGTGISTPSTGLDPTTQNIIASAVAQGMSAQQAADAAAANLQSQGVPITPTVQGQLLDAAQNTSPAPAAGMSPQGLVIAAGVLLALLVLK